MEPDIRAALGGAPRVARDPWGSAEERSRVGRALRWAAGMLGSALRPLGIDPRVFRELARARVVLALRPGLQGSAWGAAGIVIAVGMTFLAGLATGVLGLDEDPRTWVVVSQSLLVVVLGTLLFQFLAAVLVDPTDIAVVAPHPVDDRSLFAVRMAEILAYLLAFVACFTAGNVIVAAFGGAPLAALLVYPLLSLLCGVTTLGLVALLFAACLRVVGPAHFQRVTLWVQVVCGTLLFTGFQLTHVLELAPFIERLYPYRHLWPPFQYVELFELARGGPGALVPSIAAVLVPLAALALTFHFAARSYVAGLQGTLGAPTVAARWPAGVVATIGRRLVGGEERAAFDFAAALSRREPHFLRAILPQLLMFQAMALGMGFGVDRDVDFYLPASACFLTLILPNVLLQAQSTALPEACAVFTQAPVASADALLRGGVKALLVQWLCLPALVVLLVHLAVGGLGVLPRSVLALELALALALVIARRLGLPLLFSQPVRVGTSGAENVGLLVVVGLAMLGLVAVHYQVSRNPVALATAIVGVGVLDVFGWRRLSRLRLAPRYRPDLLAPYRGPAKG